MKNKIFYILSSCILMPMLYAQDITNKKEQEHKIIALIDNYAQARETKDTILLESILVNDIDQLVSSGTWRNGKKVAMKGMLKSSASRPGRRTLNIENIRFFNFESAIVDSRYQIENADGSHRRMWSTFIVVYEKTAWKIAAIRNMLPAK